MMRRPAPSFALKLVGVTFCPDYPASFFELDRMQQRRERNGKGPVRLYLEREPDNKHDPNAIAVYDYDDIMLGHIPRGIAERLAPELDAGIRWRCELIKILISSDNPDQPGCEVRLRRLKEK